jgi:TnsA-like endonuclease N terminal
MFDVTTAFSVVCDVADAELDGFLVGYVAEDGTQCRVPMADAWAVRFEAMAPARRFNVRKGQRHLPGRWWSATDGGHVGYESWLERDHLMWLDFDPAVVGIASQPFWLSWVAPDGKGVAHAPDFFARRVDDSAVVVDCRPVDRRAARDVIKFDATRRACELLGWEYRLVGAPDAIVTANLRWLAGYRHPRHRIAGLAAALRDAFAEPALLFAGAQRVGDPIAVLPVLFHLLWRHELVTDLSVSLHSCSTVTSPAVA